MHVLLKVQYYERYLTLILNQCYLKRGLIEFVCAHKWYVSLLICFFVRSFICFLVHSSIPTFNSYIYSFIYSLIHSFIHSMYKGGTGGPPAMWYTDQRKKQLDQWQGMNDRYIVGRPGPCLQGWLNQTIDKHVYSLYAGLPANTIHWNNVVLTLAQRLRRWPNIKTTLFRCIVFSGLTLSGFCWLKN